jgi:phosphoribosylamine-glycine ligase
MHVIWITRKITETFGDGIWELVKDIPTERLTIIDTAVHGRPNTLELVLKKAKEWRADMVAVTSNPVGTKEIVDGCRAVGIPAFGPIWDS